MARESSQKNNSRLRDFISLTKPRITMMCVMMTAGGYWLASSVQGTLFSATQPTGFWHMMSALLGTTCVIGGSCTLNMFLERDRDKLMKRTAERPLPTGRLQPGEALWFGIVLSVVGVAVLALVVNFLTAALAALALVLYVWVYTPLKTRTTAFLLVGTIPGAIPPLLGWTAVANQIDWVGGSLFAILVFWQLPHFLALSVMCQKDYELAGVQLVALNQGETQVRYQALMYSLLLLPASLSLIPLQVAGWLYAIIALNLGCWMIVISFHAAVEMKAARWAPRLFFASLVYLPVLTLGLLVDQLI